MQTEEPKKVWERLKLVGDSWVFKKLGVWFQRKKLEHDLKASEHFQRQCEELQCKILAEYEEKYQAEVKARIQTLKEMG